MVGMTGNRLILRLRACTCLGLLASVPALAGAVAQESPTLRRVMLSTAGIGLFDFEAKADAEGSVRLTVPLPQVDDILKSLTVYAAQGAVLGLTLPGPAPLADLFRNAPVQEGDLSSLPALLEALRGIEVTVGGPSALTGRVLSVTREELPAKEGSPVPARHRVALLTATGLRSFLLEDAQALELSDTALQRRLDDLLSRLAEARREQQRELTLRTGQASWPRAPGA